MTHLCKPKSKAAHVLSQQHNLHGGEHMGGGLNFQVEQIFTELRQCLTSVVKYKDVSSAVSL